MSNIRDKIEQKLDALFMDMATSKKPGQKVPDFRVSSFPYCPIRDLLYNDRNESFSMDFYTSIGTAFHETAQKWIAEGGFKDKVFACWKAVETGEIIGPMFRRDIPKSWDNYTIEYEEITINYKGLSGHVDLVIELFPGKFVVVDFKTTNLSGNKTKSPDAWHDKYPASRSSIIQISTYSTLLNILFGLNIVAWSLVYIDRGNVIRSPSDYHKVTRPWNKSKHEHFLGFLDEACDNNKRLQKLRKIINSSTTYSPVATKLLKSIVINRPCINRETYDDWMDYKFHKGWTNELSQGTLKGGICELKKFCTKGNKSCYSAVLAKL